MIYQKLLALCLALSTGGLLWEFILPIPDEWVNRDTGCEIIIQDSNTYPDFLIPWDSEDEKITAIPIPDMDTSSDNSLDNIPVGICWNNISTVERKSKW